MSLFRKYVTVPLGILSGVLVGVLLLITVVDVFMRTLSGGSIPGALEYAEIVLVATVFLAMGYAQMSGDHITTSVLTSHMRPGMRRAVIALSGGIGLVAIALMIALTARETLDSLSNGEYRFGLAKVPLWPARLAVTLGLFIFTVEYANTLRKHVQQKPGN